MEINFSDTKTAFISKSNQDLKRAWWLFKALESPLMVRFGKVLVQLSIKTGLPIAWAIKPTIYRHFVGGETLAECASTVDTLRKYGNYF